MNTTGLLTYEQRQAISAAHREEASCRENTAHRAAEDSARAKRLRRDEATRRGLIALWCEARQFALGITDKRINAEVRENFTVGRTGITLAELEEMIHSFDYLRNVPAEAFTK